MSDKLHNLARDERPRVPCPLCGTLVLDGARKCRACKNWLIDPPKRRPRSRLWRSFTLIAVAVAAVAAVLISQRPSPVGEAPPLTPLTTGSAMASAKLPVDRPVGRNSPSLSHGAPGATATSQHDGSEPPEGSQAPSDWRATELSIDVRPLDLAFGADGKSVYVSGDDATVLEYQLDTGKVLHMVSMPALGHRLRLLNDRYLAAIPHVDASHIPLLDTHHWERDPVLLNVGANPADIIALPDGKTAVTASSSGKRLSWFELARGRRLGNIRLPHATRHLFLVEAHGRPYVGAMGQLYQASRPAGAWLDLFDPAETPFGATRRSISVGRDSQPGAVTADGTAIFLADRVSNNASLVRVEATTEARSVPVGQGPVAAFLLGADRYGITINSQARTATVLLLSTMKRVGTLMLPGEPSYGATDERGQMLFVSLGGTAWPPSDSGAVVIGGDPPKVLAVLDTGKGAARVAVDKAGQRAAVANFWGRTVTIIKH